jgi:hypothetical protein
MGFKLRIAFENEFALTGTRITRRQLIQQAGATGALAWGATGLAVGDPPQDKPPTPSSDATGAPKTESQAAEKYAHPPGVFINRPLTQVSRMAEAMLDDMMGRNSDFFFNEASPRSGLVRDRAPVVGRSLSRVASIAATGFGLSALCIAAKYNYLRPLDCEQRVEKTLAFLLEECPHEHGFLYHFIDIDSGQRLFGSELSSIDTALLLCGVLHCRQFFTGNARIEALATTFYRRINWQWMMNGGATLSMGWLPDQGFLKYRWDTYSELTTMYLLGMGCGATAGHFLWRNRLHQRRRATVYPSVPPGLGRLPQPTRPPR